MMHCNWLQFMHYSTNFRFVIWQVDGGLQQVGRGLRDQVRERQLHRRQHTANVFQVIAKNQVRIETDTLGSKHIQLIVRTLYI